MEANRAPLLGSPFCGMRTDWRSGCRTRASPPSLSTSISHRKSVRKTRCARYVSSPRTNSSIARARAYDRNPCEIGELGESPIIRGQRPWRHSRERRACLMSRCRNNARSVSGDAASSMRARARVCVYMYIYVCMLHEVTRIVTPRRKKKKKKKKKKKRKKR